MKNKQIPELHHGFTTGPNQVGLILIFTTQIISTVYNNEGCTITIQTEPHACIEREIQATLFMRLNILI